MAEAVVPERTQDGFWVPQPGAELRLPGAHGSHPHFQIEWWYLTGHLQDLETEAWYGFQATFFRNALRPPQEEDANRSYRDDVLFLGHMAITDGNGQQFYSEERLARGSWDTYATTGDLDVRIQNWNLRRTLEERFLLDFTIGADLHLQLEMTPSKPLLRFGADGTSRKGAHPEARSYYLTYSRMEVKGSLRLENQIRELRGSAWMDHEIASRQLSSDLDGWDWCAVQFADDWEMKAYILRGEDGAVDPFSRLIWIDPEGSVRELGPEAFEWVRSAWWESPETGIRYPTQVEIRVVDPRTGRRESFHLTPLIQNQELAQRSAGFPYWEGAGIVTNQAGIQVGRSYLELVGYGGLGGALR